MKKILTLCILCTDDKVLLGMKKRGFGVGRWNGFGGKLEGAETIEAGAVREVREEVGLEVGMMNKVGILNFTFQDETKDLEVHIFKVTDFVGEPIESDEMRPEWFLHTEIPFHQMWPDDQYWFPYLLEDRLFRGTFLFDRASDAEYSAKIISEELFEVRSL